MTTFIGIYPQLQNRRNSTQQSQRKKTARRCAQKMSDLGVVASVIRRMNEVTVHWARLVLGWVTVFGRVYHHSV